MKVESKSLSTSAIESLVSDCLAEGVSFPGIFRCKRVGEREVFVGCDQDGEMVALFPPLALASQLVVNSVRFNGRLEVRWEDQTLDNATMSVLRYRSNSSDDVTNFAQVIASVLAGTKNGDSGEDYGKIIESWLELLNKSPEVALSEIIGLWGELFLITTCVGKNLAVESWQWNDSQNVDFQYRGRGLEVKTSLGDQRRHLTSLKQHLAAKELEATFASVETFSDPNGESILDLMEFLIGDLGSDYLSRSKVVSAVARRVGFGFRVRSTRLSRTAALASLRYFLFDAIPAPDFPSGVIDASWTFEIVDSGLDIGELTREVNPMALWING